MVCDLCSLHGSVPSAMSNRYRSGSSGYRAISIPLSFFSSVLFCACFVFVFYNLSLSLCNTHEEAHCFDNMDAGERHLMNENEKRNHKKSRKRIKGSTGSTCLTPVRSLRRSRRRNHDRRNDLRPSPQTPCEGRRIPRTKRNPN